MNEYYELGLYSYNVLDNGMIVVSFDDNLSLTYVNQLSLEQDCILYDAEIIENLRKYIVCYIAHFGSSNLTGKKIIFDLANVDGNIVRIV